MLRTGLIFYTTYIFSIASAYTMNQCISLCELFRRQRIRITAGVLQFGIVSPFFSLRLLLLLFVRFGWLRFFLQAVLQITYVRATKNSELGSCLGSDHSENVLFCVLRGFCSSSSPDFQLPFSGNADIRSPLEEFLDPNLNPSAQVSNI